MRSSNDNELFFEDSPGDEGKINNIAETNCSSGKILIARNGTKIVELETIYYTGKRTINWNAVKEKLKEYIGKGPADKKLDYVAPNDL